MKLVGCHLEIEISSELHAIHAKHANYHWYAKVYTILKEIY